MKKLFGAAVIVVMVFGATALVGDASQAGSCGGRGKPGNGNNWCRQCVPPPGCGVVECNKCGCDYFCP
jgi:hypothetical protein